MNFGFTEEQTLLRDQVRRFMQDECPLSRVREIMATEPGFDRSLWQKMAELGWLGLITPEPCGGLGLKWVDLTVVLEETGRGLSPLPLISHYLATTALLRVGRDEDRERWLSGMADGSTVATLALFDAPNWVHADAITLSVDGETLTGSKPFVSDAGAADLLLVAVRTTAGLGLAIVDTDTHGVTVTQQPMMDRTKRMATVTFDGVAPRALLPLSLADLEHLCNCGAVAVTAEMVGAAEAALTMTSNYAKERVQFGELIGKYQGVKHRLADIFVDVESFKSLAYYAAWTVDDGPDELPRAASLAKAYASDAFAKLGIDGVGLHGAIGFTAEYDVQLYLKRSKWARPMYGDSDYHYERVATLGGL